MSILTIKHSPGPFDVRVVDCVAYLSSPNRGAGKPVLGRSSWLDFSQVVVQSRDSNKPDPEGVANLNLFRAAPALLQVAIAFVHEHAKRGGVYDQILPIDEQDSMVRAAMRAVEEALSGELP